MATSRRGDLSYERPRPRQDPLAAAIAITVVWGIEEPVLTIRQPWASAIFRAGKEVENRPRPTHFRGRLWVHAGLFRDRADADRWARRNDLWIPEEPLLRGVILGSVELVDCVADSASPWALRGNYHWMLRHPMLLTRPVHHHGGLGFSWRRPPRGERRSARRHRKSYWLNGVSSPAHGVTRLQPH